MNDVDHALSEIADIRARLAASTRFLGIAPGVNALAALLSLVAAVMQNTCPEIFAPDLPHYVLFWAAVMIASMVIVSIEAVSRTRRMHGQMADAMLASALRQILPFYTAGFVVTLVILKFGSGSAWLLPGLWQILIGLLGFSALQSLPRAMIWVAGWYFLCGSVVLGLAGWNGGVSPWMMGLPLAFGQIAVAAVHIRNQERGDNG